MMGSGEPKGFARANTFMSGGGYWRQHLQLGAGDRARFWFLSTGWDGKLDSVKMHNVPSDKGFDREFCCVDSLTNGAERCPYCIAGNSSFRTRFAVWVHVTSLLHMGDNPDPGTPPWKMVGVRESDGNTRRMFLETVNAVRLIYMGPGQDRKWYNQFYATYTQHGSLQKFEYELMRTGVKLETEYTLRTVRPTPVPVDILAEAETLPDIVDVFRTMTGGGGSSLHVPAAEPTGMYDSPMEAMEDMEVMEELPMVELDGDAPI